MTLTLKDLNLIAKKYNLPVDVIICIPMDNNPSSINIRVNYVSVTKKEHSYGDRDVLSILCSNKHDPNDVVVSVLVDKNKWLSENLGDLK